jgi:pimeloyl-ACP methyl ester carboxylesterase
VQQIIVPQCAHWIHLDQPELVINSIRKMAMAATEPAAAAG